MDKVASFSLGFDRGNYGNAYQSTVYRDWRKNQTIPQDVDPGAYEDGMLLGFFSGFQSWEIYDNELATKVLKARDTWEMSTDELSEEWAAAREQ